MIRVPAGESFRQAGTELRRAVGTPCRRVQVYKSPKEMMTFVRVLNIGEDHWGGIGLSHQSGDGEVFLYNMSEGGDNLRIELEASPAFQLLKCLPERTPSPVGTIAGNSVKGICHR